MKSKYLMGAIALMLLVGCAKETPVATEYEPRQDIVQAQTRAGVVENAIYDAMLDVWKASQESGRALLHG